MPKKKNKETKDLILLNPDREFLGTISNESLRHIIAAVHQCLTDGMSEDQMLRFCNITAEQYAAIKEHPDYIKNVHAIIDDDGEFVRSMVRSKLAPITKVLLERAENGDMDAIKEVMKITGATRTVTSKEQSQWQGFIEMMKLCGIEDHLTTNTNKIREAKERRRIEQQKLEEEVIDCDYEILEDEESKDEDKSDE